jgi:hypothetical protein
MLSKPCNVLFLLWRVRPPDRRKSKAKGRGSTQAPGSPSQSPSSSPNLPNMGGVWSPGSNPPSPSLRSPSRNSTTPSPPHGLLGTGSGGEWRLMLMVPVGLPTMIDVCPPCNECCTRCHLYVCALRLLKRICVSTYLVPPCILWLLLHLPYRLVLCDCMSVLVLCFNLPLCTPCVAVGTGESADTPARDPYSAGYVPPGMPGSTPTTLDLGEGALSQSTPSRSRRSTSTSPRRATVLALLPWLGTFVECMSYAQ